MVKYQKKRPRRRRRTMETALVPRVNDASLMPYMARGASRAMPYAHGAQLGYEYLANAYKISQALGGRGKTTPLRQTGAQTRATIRRNVAKGGRTATSRFINKMRAKRRNDRARHEKMKAPQARPVNKGKGFNQSANGVIVTHPRSVIPKWKQKRLYQYKYSVFQTVLLSKSNRLATSNNTLQTTRYPIPVPQCLDGERTMSMIFTPFCSHYSGIHSTYYRKINSAGSALDHDVTQPLDVIQNKADVARHDHTALNGIDGAKLSQILYEGALANSVNTRADSNVAQITAYKNQLLKSVGVDLVFTASRAFPMVISVSVVRAIKPQTPYTLDTQGTRELTNGVGNHGMSWDTWRTEYHHQFTLPGLRVNKKPPSYSVNKVLKTNFMQTNSFNENTTHSDMAQASQNLLGSNIHSHVDEVTDGNMAGNFYILIKYRKKQQPQQFTYTQTIVSNPGKDAKAEITIPMISEQSFDIPGNAYRGNNTSYPVSLADSGASTGDPAGAPLEASTNNILEDRGTFYIHGKLKYEWGFKKECDQIPSLMSSDPTSADFKKSQSLNIDITYPTGNADHSIYTQSPSHVTLAANTSTTGV